jgi:diguanylate cyclase
MTTKAFASREPVGRFLGWLGLRPSRRRGHPRDDIAEGAGPNATRQAREHLVESIASFLLDNGLDVSPANLTLAHGAFAGGNPRLARQIAAREQAGEAISQSWLDDMAGDSFGRSHQDELEQLMTRLESNLEAFHTNTTAARTLASDYGSTLEQHVADLEQVQKTGRIVSNLAGLAKAMLERTRKAEDDMRKREDEAKALRRSLARAKRDAELDYLTGLPNRRAFETLLERQYREAQAASEPLTVAFCDIDNFKAVNDTHGHDAGDRVLKLVAEMLAKISGDNCHVARHGGEEFVMLFRGLAPDEALARLDEARESLAARRLINRKTDAPFGQITFSGGVADVFGHADQRAALKAADEALYRAKDAGRNRIELA